MHLKNILIVICSAIFSQYANGAENKPGKSDKFPDFPKVCEEIPDKKYEYPYKKGEKGGKVRKLQTLGWKDKALCSISQPADVVNYRVTCQGATFIDFAISDCCIPGDRWQLKGKVWDTHPNTAVTTSPGDSSNSAGVPGRVYN